MNVVLASGGYPWTVIRVEDRAPYMSALESASVETDPRPFAEFVAERVKSSRAEGPEMRSAPTQNGGQGLPDG